jgi:hypothetical protein
MLSGSASLLTQNDTVPYLVPTGVVVNGVPGSDPDPDPGWKKWPTNIDKKR